ncbi:MAG TPA: PxKF domain-containing protein, partial [Anaerolineales bacterium]|nr:PxKF domain-containing protein [Anaerolineales bacterium]
DFSQSLGNYVDPLENNDIVCISAWPSDDPGFPYCQSSESDFEENTIPVGYRKVSLSAPQGLIGDEIWFSRWDGRVTLSTFDTDTAILNLQYGSEGQPLNLNLASKGSQFEVEIFSYDLDVSLPLSLRVTDGNGNSASASTDFSGIGIYTISFSAFAGVNFADIDQILMTFTDGDVFGVDFGFDNFLVSGEPLQVSGYVFSGFYSPVDNGLVNTAKAGQAIPVKWRLTDSFGAPVSDPSSFSKLVSLPVNCSTLTSLQMDAVEEYAAGSSGLQYNGDGYWQFNWKTLKTYAGTCRAMNVQFSDGTTSPVVVFQFKK